MILWQSLKQVIFIKCKVSISLLFLALSACAVKIPEDTQKSESFSKETTQDARQNNESTPDLIFDFEEIEGLVSFQNTDAGDFIEIGDMLIQYDVLENQKNGRKALRVRQPKIWPNGTFLYRFSSDVASSPFRKNAFIKACNDLVENSGIRCREITQTELTRGYGHAVIVDSNYNRSYVGWIGGPQNLEIYNWSIPVIISHEIKHALGWFHEHQRLDRDSFVNIINNNVQNGTSSNFLVIGHEQRSRPYDFSSIMHYGPRAFAKNPSFDTITPLPAYASQRSNMGQRNFITQIDKAEIRDAYGEPSKRWCGRTGWSREPERQGCISQCLESPAVGEGLVFICGCGTEPICP